MLKALLASPDLYNLFSSIQPVTGAGAFWDRTNLVEVHLGLSCPRHGEGTFLRLSCTIKI